MTDDKRENRACILEVIACTVEDAINAERGGAHRLEIISRFETGGLTPLLDLVREIQSAVKLPLRVMLRESDSYEVLDEKEIEKLCAAARELNAMRVDGIVLGFLQGRKVDVELTKRVLACAPNLKATFHHAFEETKDKFAAIEVLKSTPQIDKILTRGGNGNWAEKYSLLEIYAQAAQPAMKILAGGGVDAEAIKLLKKKTSVREFHVGSAARADGAVSKELAARLAEAARGGLKNYD